VVGMTYTGAVKLWRGEPLPSGAMVQPVNRDFAVRCPVLPMAF